MELQRIMKWVDGHKKGVSDVLQVADYMAAPFPGADFSPTIVAAWRWNLDSGDFHCDEVVGVTSWNARTTNILKTLDQAQVETLTDKAKKAYANDVEFSVEITIEESAHPIGSIYRVIGAPYKKSDSGAMELTGVLLRLGGSTFLNDQYLLRSDPLIYIKDKDHRFIFVSRACLDAIGKQANQVVGKTLSECAGRDMTALDRFEKWLMNTDLHIEFPETSLLTQENVQGSDTIYSAKRFALQNSDGELLGTGACLVDISIDEKALRIIANLDIRRQQLIEALPVLILYFDRFGKVQLVNSKVSKLLKTRKETLYGKTMSEIAPHWLGAIEIEEGVRDILVGKKSSVRIKTRYHQDDKSYWIKIEISPVINIDNSIANALMVVRDVSYMQQQKQKLEDQDVRAQALMENSFEAMYCVAIKPPMPIELSATKQVEWIINHAYYEDCNQRCAELLKVDVEKILYRKVSDVLGWLDVEHRLIRAVVDHQFDLNHVEIEYTISSEQEWWEHSAKPIIADGKLYELWGSFRNVTESKRRSVELESNEARYRSFIENSHEGIFEARLLEPISTDLSGEEISTLLYETLYIHECNDEFSHLCGKNSSKELVGKLLQEASGRDLVEKLVAEFVRGEFQVARLPLNVTMNGAQATWISISLVGVFKEGLLSGCWGTIRDVTERYHYLQKLEYQANHDSLTHLPNRQKFYAVLEQHLQYITKDNPLAVILLDLDRFKELNDTLGHHTGDLLLKKLGPRLEQVVRKVDGMVARLGGDEFAIVIPRVSEDGWRGIAQQLCDVVNEPFNLKGFQAEVKASIGLALAPKHAHDVSGLMRYADIAMYQAKNESLGFVEYDASLDAYTPRRLSLMNDLGRAIRENQFELYYQPKIDLGGRFIRGFEALLRWNHPTLGFLPPSEFVPLAESTENIKPMTLWVLDSAIQRCSEWMKRKLDCKVAVNLSARNLLDESIVAAISNLLEHYQVPPRLLELEITESAIMLDPKRAAEIMRQMGALGVNLSIDDYGTGYSSLAYLKSLPVDTLKIDYSFVKDMLIDKHDAIIVNSTIHLAHNLGLKVVAEGVESADALAELDGMGCDLAQGYYIAPPMPAEAVEPWMSNAGWSSLRSS